MRSEPGYAQGSKNEVPEIGKKIGQQRIAARSADEGSPAGVAANVCNPVQQREGQDGCCDRVEAPGGRGTDLRDSEWCKQTCCNEDDQGEAAREDRFRPEGRPAKAVTADKDQ